MTISRIALSRCRNRYSGPIALPLRSPKVLCTSSSTPDLQEQRISTPLLVPEARLYRALAAPAPNPEALQEAAALLVNAAWPVIIAGEVGRTPQALAPLRELAETLAAP